MISVFFSAQSLVNIIIPENNYIIARFSPRRSTSLQAREYSMTTKQNTCAGLKRWSLEAQYIALIEILE